MQLLRQRSPEGAKVISPALKRWESLYAELYFLHWNQNYRLQYGHVIDNSNGEGTTPPTQAAAHTRRLREWAGEIVRKTGETALRRHAVWWVGGVVLAVLIAWAIWLVRKRQLFSSAWDKLNALQQSPTLSPWSLPLGLAAVVVLVLILWKVPHWQVGRVKRLSSKERFDRVNEARKTLATILGGVLLLVGFFGTWQNIKVAQKAASIAQESASTSQEALRVSQEGQITDRFTKAIEQLGATDASGKPKLEVRLGGIYALERIANDSERDHWPIMEVLCTYVRENARKQESPTGKERKAKEPTEDNHASASTPHPRADIQAILTVLGRRNRTYETKEERLDLHETDLRGGLLQRDFSGTDLYQADLSGADLEGANLRGAFLEGANLRGADLSEANLSRADLLGANLSRADLIEAHLSGLDLSGLDLSRANLKGADLSGANLSGAVLHDAYLYGANLNGADLSMSPATTEGFSVGDGADLSGAYLGGARLNAADLSETLGLTQQQIDEAKGDATTKLPAGLHMPDSWKK